MTMNTKTEATAKCDKSGRIQPAITGILRVSVLLAGLLFVSVNSRGDALRLPNQDPEAIARGNAFAATANDPAAIYYNPAGITQIQGQQASGGLYLISASEKFSGTRRGLGQHQF